MLSVPPSPTAKKLVPPLIAARSSTRMKGHRTDLSVLTKLMCNNPPPSSSFVSGLASFCFSIILHVFEAQWPFFQSNNVSFSPGFVRNNLPSVPLPIFSFPEGETNLCQSAIPQLLLDYQNIRLSRP